DDLLSIDLDPTLLPTPPCGKVLEADERAAVRATVDAFNAEIAAAITETAQARGVSIVLVDMAAQFDRIHRDGVDLNGDGTPALTTRFLGVIYGLVGVLHTQSGDAVLTI